MFLEIGARSSLGEGVLDIDVNMAEDVLIPTPNPGDDVPDLSEISLQNDIFDQMGSEPNEPINLEDVSKDRRIVDSTALGDWLGMDEQMQEAVYEALIQLVGGRIERSDSV